MKKYFVFSAFYFFSIFINHSGITVHAQALQIDSLKKLLLINNHDNNQKLHLLNSLSSFQSNISPDDALNNSEKAITLAQKLGNEKELAVALHNKGFILLQNNQYTESLIYLGKVIALNLDVIDDLTLSICYTHLGEAYFQIKNYDSSIVFFNKGILISQEINNYRGLSFDYLGIAKSLSAASDKTLIKVFINPINRNKLRIEFLQKAVVFGIKSNSKEIVRDAYLALSEFYERQNKPDVSFDYYKKYITYKDSISNIDNNNTIAILQIQFNTEKKEQQIAMLNTDQKIKAKVIGKAKTERNGFLVGSVLLLLIAGVGFNRYTLKKKANKELSLALNQLKELQHQLIENEKAASLGQLTAGIAHEIQNPLNFVINFSQLNKKILQEWDETSEHNLQVEILADLKDNNSKIKKHGNRANQIIQSMLMHATDNHLHAELTDFNELCQEAFNISWQAFSIVNPDFVCNSVINLQSNLTHINLVKPDISRVVINLLNNSLYAIKEKSITDKSSNFIPEIKLETFLKEKNIILKISDNGIGISESIKNKIFHPFFTTKPANLGTGLGLSISNDITKAHNGELYLQSSSSEGTVFILSLPT